MNSKSIDDILTKLSIKFNRIFCDREFVCCVSEDFQTIIENTNECCVLVFPILNPNYLRVVRYQAKLLDLAVISLGSGSAKSVGVCHKKHILAQTEIKDDPNKNTGINEMAENSNSTKKKRPPIQLYVPPAQRRSRICEKSNTLKIKSQLKIESTCSSQLDSKICNKEKKVVVQSVQEKKEISEDPTPLCFCTDDIDCIIASNGFPYFNYKCNSFKMILFKDLFHVAKLLIFNIKRIKHSFHLLNWKVQGRVLITDYLDFNKCPNVSVRIFHFKDETRYKIIPNIYSFKDDKIRIEDTYFSLENKVIFEKNEYDILHIDFTNFCLHCYLSNEHDCLQIEDLIQNLSSNILKSYKVSLDTFDLNDFIVTESPKMPCDEAKSVYNGINVPQSEKANEEVEKTKQTDKVIVLEERIEPVNNSPKITKETKVKKNEHEQEKEIMRRAKQNINRKTRPIIKYIEDDNTLKIGRNDNVNNWEDLFDENGELVSEIFSEIIQKVGPEVTIVKAEEDYSEYVSKQLEELEHMVELYDFPPALETQDLISAFNEINSDSMYVKWVDDTHAILVLGSHIQARKAIAISNPLIKVRPMSAASSSTLEKANQFDLKPAMKRPQTNLQTARRLITSHLGAKSQITKEQSAKEREDLRVAKELKKLAKQNERDAWEGSLRSNLN